MHIDMRTQT